MRQSSIPSQIAKSACFSCDEKVNEMLDTKAIFLSLVVEANDDGYLAECPGIQGAFAEGDSIEEAIFNCVDVIKLISAYRAERGESMGFNIVELTPKTRMTVAMPVGVGT
jgi:predicted RNase H-like HicB family nuclease